MVDPSTIKFIKISGFITLGLILLIFILTVVLYSAKVFPFEPYKPKPPDKSNLTYYCPNGCPDPKTGKPKDSAPINKEILQQINSNLTSYKANNTGEWGAV